MSLSPLVFLVVALMQLIQWMLHPDPVFRARISDVCSHKWATQPVNVEDYSWHQVMPNFGKYLKGEPRSHFSLEILQHGDLLEHKVWVMEKILGHFVSNPAHPRNSQSFCWYIRFSTPLGKASLSQNSDSAVLTYIQWKPVSVILKVTLSIFKADIQWHNRALHHCFTSLSSVAVDIFIVEFKGNTAADHRPDPLESDPGSDESEDEDEMRQEMIKCLQMDKKILPNQWSNGP